MCGVFGLLNFQGSSSELNGLAQKMESSISHRGPDDHGVHFFANGFAGNVRLAIVDRSGGKQPIHSADGRYGIVYNGEVYNHLDLRRELLALGFNFQSESDTEVVLNAYIAWGIEAFSKIKGMFAFCIWDKDLDEVLLVRDPLGIKPLYLGKSGKSLYFCSEMRGITNLPNFSLKINPVGLQDYLHFRYIAGPYTLFEDISKVEPGTYLKITKSGSCSFRYWDLEVSNESYLGKFEQGIGELDKLLLNSVRSHLMGEVEVGVLLSGGVDSSLIASYVSQSGAKLKTFNIGFEEVNEFEYSRSVAQHLNLEHIEVLTSLEEMRDLYPAVSDFLDEPLADPACLPLYALCRVLKEHVTVVLSGEGADELFGGYNQYRSVLGVSGPWWDLFSQFAKDSWYFLDPAEFLRDRTLPPKHLRFRKYFEEQGLLQGMLHYDLKTWLPDDLMMKADKILMSHSLEGRFPFLDMSVLEFADQIPPEWKIKGGRSKHILKELAKERLPDTVINRPKMGFTVPIKNLLFEMRELVMDSLRQVATTELADYLDMKKLNNLVEGFYKGSKGIPELKVWTVFTLVYWYVRQVECQKTISDSSQPRPLAATPSHICL